jgi:hypothetical protein
VFELGGQQYDVQLNVIDDKNAGRHVCGSSVDGFLFRVVLDLTPTLALALSNK